jgi:glycosyltransferase involved in cell wall biosynthesis
MRIAVMVKSLLNNADGVARHAIYLSHELVAMGHQVTVWAVEYDHEHCHDLVKDLEVRSLRNTRRTVLAPARIPGIRMLTWLQLIISAYHDQINLARVMTDGYDIVNPHGNLIIWGALEYKRKFEVPVVWLCNDFWPPAYHAPNASSRRVQKLKLNIKQLISLPIKTYDQAVVRKVDEIAVLSEIVKAQMNNYYDIFPEIVRPCVDSDRFGHGDGGWVKSRYSISDKSFLLLTICSLMTRRRLEDVIQAIEILVKQGYDVIYLIAGRVTHQPEYTQFIRTEVTKRHLESRVLIIGEVSEDELVDYYQACDAFIWPADENQSWGMAGTEAMSSGKPIVVSKANGLAEILEDKVTGFLVPPRSPHMIAKTIIQLISDPALVRTVGKSGQQLVRENFSWRNNAQRMLELFQRAIAGQ